MVIKEQNDDNNNNLFVDQLCEYNVDNKSEIHQTNINRSLSSPVQDHLFSVHDFECDYMDDDDDDDDNDNDNDINKGVDDDDYNEDDYMDSLNYMDDDIYCLNYVHKNYHSFDSDNNVNNDTNDTNTDDDTDEYSSDYSTSMDIMMYLMTDPFGELDI
ncbi:unnamed protein product [Adineta steineri]|uniref:Uncharacterized protein n=1 Tax=Adineta steineri TaxID=433720 RepID=A0A816A1L7_9BILA|nr:unnamed protein product [Adineta steineri]CAF1592193.1 unnamed protein product [Adineta steineri]